MRLATVAPRHGPRRLPEPVKAHATRRALGRMLNILLKSARRAGLLAPDILDALGLAGQPLLRGALRAAE